MVKFLDFIKSISKPSAPGKIGIRQSEWTVRGDSIAKKWGIIGALQGGDELTILIDVTFSRSQLTDQIDPMVFIFIDPNTLGAGEGYITLQVALADQAVDAPIAVARIGSADDGSILISPTDRIPNEQIFEVLSEMKLFRIFAMNQSEVLLNLTLPNDGEDFIAAAKVAAKNS